MVEFKRGDVIRWALYYPSGEPADELLLAVVLYKGVARIMVGDRMGEVLRLGSTWQWAQDGGWVKV